MIMTRSTRAPEVRRKRAAALREEVRLADRRRRRRTIALVAGLVLAVGAGIAVQAARTTADGPSGAPGGVTADGFGFAVGKASAPVTVEVYEDFLCPACRRFEESAGAQLRSMAADGAARVVYRPMAFLDGSSTNRYSTRALNAAACASDSGAGGFSTMHGALFDAQPAEGGPGPVEGSGRPDADGARQRAAAGGPDSRGAARRRRPGRRLSSATPCTKETPAASVTGKQWSTKD